MLPLFMFATILNDDMIFGVRNSEKLDEPTFMSFDVASISITLSPDGRVVVHWSVIVYIHSYVLIFISEKGFSMLFFFLENVG